MSEWHLVRWADLPPWREPPKANTVDPETIWTSDEIMASAARVPWPDVSTGMIRRTAGPAAADAVVYQRKIWWLQRKRDMGWP